MDMKKYIIRTVMIFAFTIGSYFAINELVKYYKWFDTSYSEYIFYGVIILFSIFLRFQPTTYELSKKGIFSITAGFPDLIFYSKMRSLQIEYKVKNSVESEFLIIKFKNGSNKIVNINLNRIDNRYEFLKTIQEKTGLEVWDDVKRNKKDVSQLV